MNGNQVMRVSILGGSLADVDGNQYASVYVGQRAEPGSNSARGVEVMKVTCDPDVFRGLNPDPSAFPVDVDMHIRLKRAGGGRMGQHCVQIVPVGSRGPAKGVPAAG